MPDTTVSLTTADLAANFQNQIRGSNLAPLRAAVLNRLNNPPSGFHSQHAAYVTAEVMQGGAAFKFVITAPLDLDPATVKAILR